MRCVLGLSCFCLALSSCPVGFSLGVGVVHSLLPESLFEHPLMGQAFLLTDTGHTHEQSVLSGPPEPTGHRVPSPRDWAVSQQSAESTDTSADITRTASETCAGIFQTRCLGVTTCLYCLVWVKPSKLPKKRVLGRVYALCHHQRRYKDSVMLRKTTDALSASTKENAVIMTIPIWDVSALVSRGDRRPWITHDERIAGNVGSQHFLGGV